MSKGAQANSNALTIVADSVTLSDALPTPCESGLMIDGSSEPLTALDKTIPPSSWLTAKSVEITQCSGTLQGNWNFPAAKVRVLAPANSFNVGVSITSLNSYQLDSAVKAIDLNSSGISLNTANGCLQITGVGKANDPFGLSIVGAAGNSTALQPSGSISIGGGSGSIMISGAGSGLGSGALIGVNAMVTNSSGSGALVLVHSK